MKPHLTLVGAGPGDPELITLKGLNTLKQADVILYDALVHPALLEHAKTGAIKINVGKRAGNHGCDQDEINSLIVEHAKKYGHVVRLKGGDPFVFGRGYEEIEYAESFGIETSVVPGLSSSTSLTGLQKIPLTHRGLTESFWVLTGTTNSHQLSKDIAVAAHSSATMVILMGMSKLREITDIFIRLGLRDMPVAVIQNGSLPDEKTVIGRIENIAELVEKENIGTPAIIVVGEVVNLISKRSQEGKGTEGHQVLSRKEKRQRNIPFPTSKRESDESTRVTKSLINEVYSWLEDE